MVTERYLTISRRGNVRMTTRYPTTGNGELVIRLRVNIDPAVFANVVPQAEMTVNQETLRQGITLRVDTNEPRYFNRDHDVRVFAPPVLTPERTLDEIINEGYAVTDMPTRRRHDPAQDE